jgi:ketosteroid isomerase-like protein
MYNATETIKLVQLLDAFCEAFNRHDPAAIVSMITDDCEFRPALGDKQFGASIKGKSAIKEAILEGKIENTFEDAVQEMILLANNLGLVPVTTK